MPFLSIFSPDGERAVYTEIYKKHAHIPIHARAEENGTNFSKAIKGDNTKLASKCE